jgi:hypothetical protein
MKSSNYIESQGLSQQWAAGTSDGALWVGNAPQSLLAAAVRRGAVVRAVAGWFPQASTVLLTAGTRTIPDKSCVGAPASLVASLRRTFPGWQEHHLVSVHRPSFCLLYMCRMRVLPPKTGNCGMARW